jgi:hypothetical protein
LTPRTGRRGSGGKAIAFNAAGCGAVAREAYDAPLERVASLSRPHLIEGEKNDGVAKRGPHIGIGLCQTVLDEVDILRRPAAASRKKLILDHIFKNYQNSPI